MPSAKVISVQRKRSEPSLARAPEQVILSPGFNESLVQFARLSALGLSISTIQCSTVPSGWGESTNM